MPIVISSCLHLIPLAVVLILVVFATLAAYRGRPIRRR